MHEDTRARAACSCNLIDYKPGFVPHKIATIRDVKLRSWALELHKRECAAAERAHCRHLTSATSDLQAGTCESSRARARAHAR